jgi:16S rRNA (uracil1498-N3)-methyltransferase
MGGGLFGANKKATKQQSGMHRFYLPAERSRGDSLALTGREAHHAAHVLRVRRGERVAVLNGAGQELRCEVGAAARDRVDLAVIERREALPREFSVTLLQAIPKGKTIEAIIEKATELGAARIVPLLSERVVVQLDAASAAAKLEKWHWVAVDAIKQCGTPWLPRIEPPTTPREFLGRREPFDLPLVASLQPGSRHPREYFGRFKEQHGRPPASVCVWVGPEGDFTAGEVRAMECAGARPMTLGPLVLRSETAAVYCLSVISYELRSSESAAGAFPGLTVPGPGL